VLCVSVSNHSRSANVVRAMENTSEQGVGEAHRKDVAPFRQMDESYRINASFRWLTASKHSAEEAT